MVLINTYYVFYLKGELASIKEDIQNIPQIRAFGGSSEETSLFYAGTVKEISQGYLILHEQAMKQDLKLLTTYADYFEKDVDSGFKEVSVSRDDIKVGDSIEAYSKDFYRRGDEDPFIDKVVRISK